MRNNEKVVTKDESDDDEMPKLKDISDGDRVEYPLEGKALVTRHSLSTQIKVDKMEQ